MPARNFVCLERASERVTMKTLYDLLGVRRDADAEAVKKAFRRAVKAHHPDLNANNEDAAERFREIIAANAILRSIEQRAAYDRHLELERRRLWSEWKRAVVQCAIAAAVLSVALVGASALFVALPTAATVHGKAGKETVRRSTDVATIRLIASDGPNAQGGSADKHEDTKAVSTAIEASTAPDAITVGTDRPITPDEPIKFASRDAKFYSERAIGAYRKGDFDGAIADFDEAIRIEPNNPEAFHERGLLWRLKGELDRALLDLDHAIRFSFTDASIYNDRGLVWYQKGRYDRALADFNQAIKINPNFAVAYINRGMTLQRRGDFALANADFDRAIQIEPTNFVIIRLANFEPLMPLPGPLESKSVTRSQSPTQFGGHTVNMIP